MRGAKNAIFWYAGCEKSGRVGNPVKELEMKSSLSLYELAITVQNLGENGQFLRKLEPFS